MLGGDIRGQRSISQHPEHKGLIRRALRNQTVASHRGLPAHVRHSPHHPAITAAPTRAQGALSLRQHRQPRHCEHRGQGCSLRCRCPHLPGWPCEPRTHLGPCAPLWLLWNPLVFLLWGRVTHLRPKNIIFPWTHVALASQPWPSNLSFPLAFQLALAFLTTSLNTQSD